MFFVSAYIILKDAKNTASFKEQFYPDTCSDRTSESSDPDFDAGLGLKERVVVREQVLFTKGLAPPSRRKRRVAKVEPPFSKDFSSARKCASVFGSQRKNTISRAKKVNSPLLSFTFQSPVEDGTCSIFNQKTYRPRVFVPKGKKMLTDEGVSNRLAAETLKEEDPELAKRLEDQEIAEVISNCDSDELNSIIEDEFLLGDDQPEPLRDMEDIVKSNQQRTLDVYEKSMKMALKKVQCMKKFDELAKQQPYRIIDLFQSIGKSFCGIFSKISSCFYRHRSQTQPEIPLEVEQNVYYTPTLREIRKNNPHVPPSFFTQEGDQSRSIYLTPKDIQQKYRVNFERV